MNVLIVDDDFASRAGMVQSLKHWYPDCGVLEASGVKSAIEAIRENLDIDLVLLDLNVEDSRGLDTLSSVKRWCEEEDVNPRLVVVSGAGDYDDGLIFDAIEQCATGFILKGTKQEIFRSAIAITLAGSIFIPEKFLSKGLAPRRTVEERAKAISFTRREVQVAELLVKGLTYKQIARRLQDPERPMSDHTVRVHVQRMAWKIRAAGDLQADAVPAKARVLSHLAAIGGDPSLRT